MSLHEISFLSANGRDTIKAWSYTPLGKPRAVIQLLHGYGEHSRRYLHMISAFNQAGFAVYADDHLGHGKTGVDNGTLGDPHSGGYMTFLKDEKTLHDIARKDFPDVPYFVFGHSWGSCLARGYAAHYGEDLTGLLLCGLCSLWKPWQDAYTNETFRKAYEADPYQPVGECAALIFGGMVDRIENPLSGSDWIANDPAIVADHAGDPFNTFDTTIEMAWDFVQLFHFIESPEWAPMVPKIPVYLISGDQDPCGNYGEGLYHVANMLENTGHKTTTRCYTGYRHEIHNELAIRETVEAGLIDFVNGVLEKA